MGSFIVSMVILVFAVAAIEILAKQFNVPTPVVQLLRLLLAFVFVMAVLSLFGFVSPAWMVRS